MSKIKNNISTKQPATAEGLPRGWELKRIGDVAETTSGGTPSRSKKNYWGGKIPWLKSGELNDGFIESAEEYITEEGLKNSNAKLFEKGTLLLALYGATAGRIGILNFETATNQAVCAIQNKYNKFKTKYFYYFLLQQRPQIIKDSFGGAQPNISQGYIREIQIPLPPLPEQQWIVQQLDALFFRIDKAIQLTRENLDHCTHLLPAALNEVFGEMSKSKVKSEKLKIVTTKIGSGSTPSGGQRAYKASGISLIRSMNVYDEGFELDGLAYIDDEQADKLSNVVVETDDVLLNITGASVARCCIVPEHVLPARVNQHVSILRFRKNLILPEFAHYFFISPDTKFKLLKDSGGGATREAITKAMLEDFEIRFPDIQQQQRIVTYLNQLSSKQQQLQQHYSKQLQQLQALKSSLLDGAFKGEL